MLQPAPVRSDGGAMLLEHTISLTNLDTASTDLRVEGFYTLHETLVNDTGQTWAGLHIQLVRDRGAGILPAPVGPGDATSFMRNELEAAWRPSVEVRLNGLYLGLPGGSWTLARSRDATSMTLGFVELPVLPGQRLDLRLRVLCQSDALSWRLAYSPRVTSHVLPVCPAKTCSDPFPTIQPPLLSDASQDHP
jgi:hypothetical protein